MLQGTIQIEHLGQTNGSEIIKTKTIRAHESELSMLEFNRPGTLLASSSERGTIIRVFSTHTGDLLHELRRGADKAIIFSICFSSNSRFLACTSDKFTVHIFELYTVGEPMLQQNESQNQQQQINHANSSITSHGNRSHNGRSDSVLGNISPYRMAAKLGNVHESLKETVGRYIPKYLTTECKRSVVRFPVSQSVTKCAFGTKANTLFVAGMDGSFAKYAYDTGSGEYERLFHSSVHDPVR